jgi:hypothetical protein
MSEAKPQKSPASPWQVPVAVDDIAPTGQHFDLVADAGTRSAVARIAGLRDLPRLEAKFDVTRHGSDGLQVSGRVSATVGQNCVVTLEPLDNDLEEEVNLLFLPRAAPVVDDAETQTKPRDVKWDDPEPLVGGVVDLGALATEFLMLGLDPYPRKPGAVFEAPQDHRPEDGPFAALAKLSKDANGRNGS